MGAKTETAIEPDSAHRTRFAARPNAAVAALAAIVPVLDVVVPLPGSAADFAVLSL